MTQKELIIKEIEALAFDQNIEFTAKDLLSNLITKYPECHWKRGTVADVLSRYTTSNDIGRRKEGKTTVYYSKAGAKSDYKIYTLKTSDLEVSGTLCDIVKIISTLGLPYRYDLDKDGFINYTELHINHLENIICKDLENMPKEVIKQYLNSKIFKTYVSKK